MASKDYEIAYTEVFEGENYRATVHHPKLTPEEYERRHKQINDAAVRMLYGNKNYHEKK